MSFNPRPCPHCGGTSFHVIPDIGFDVYVAPQVFGTQEAAKIKMTRPIWYATLVGCTQCGRTEAFSNLGQLAEKFPTAYTATSNRST